MSENSKLLITGLGNPGKKYEMNRHNIGFIIADVLAESWNISFDRDSKCQSAKKSGDHLIIIIKPQEYMNLSGKAVQSFMSQYKIHPSNHLVLHDEIDFPFAKIKMKVGGGHAGHNGLRDIMEKTGNGDFHRLRFGVGKPQQKEFVADYVLSNFFDEEKKQLSELIKDSIKLIEEWVKSRK
ncbi:MAG TPA: aminoacyl-tRNA hydrolase [Leptospiraceae bacterium]|nr:aminoacyl-tRNA hydrolase [Leptospiraceae bacterium]HMY68114.1 aminoacyl-tRNA hydrolase [Leptospiraceae bacterium]HNF12181.1 aminoacyl-tRNA hydrolase [Leptospiraceae bacterium]HNF24122.1 aminoacyl-tRNA hydrolase [Leptospiraceae bacterium]HNH08303.1 aminoacyl-tRNA hydrolase [Leptospiraceae bacterium]